MVAWVQNTGRRQTAGLLTNSGGYGYGGVRLAGIGSMLMG